MIGISIRENIGIGDKVQFSSLPENYYLSTGKKLVDVSNCWIFEHNPFVVRDEKCDEIIELWNSPQIRPYFNPRVLPNDPTVYLSNAEVIASVFKVPTALNRPRLYKYEDYPFENRELIYFQVQGKSHGLLPDFVIDHVIKKYKKTGRLVQIGLPEDPDVGLERVHPDKYWDWAQVLSTARMFIGPDSGPSWIAACYDVWVKKIRLRKVHGQKTLEDWVPLEIANKHSHWDDRLFHIHIPYEHDLGAFYSYLRL